MTGEMKFLADVGMRDLPFPMKVISRFGMLHSYSTVIGTEKSSWVPSSGYEEMEI